MHFPPSTLKFLLPHKRSWTQSTWTSWMQQTDEKDSTMAFPSWFSLARLVQTSVYFIVFITQPPQPYLTSLPVKLPLLFFFVIHYCAYFFVFNDELNILLTLSDCCSCVAAVSVLVTQLHRYFLTVVPILFFNVAKKSLIIMELIYWVKILTCEKSNKFSLKIILQMVWVCTVTHNLGENSVMRLVFNPLPQLPSKSERF